MVGLAKKIQELSYLGGVNRRESSHDRGQFVDATTLLRLSLTSLDLTSHSLKLVRYDAVKALTGFKSLVVKLTKEHLKLTSVIVTTTDTLSVLTTALYKIIKAYNTYLGIYVWVQKMVNAQTYKDNTQKRLIDENNRLN